MCIITIDLHAVKAYKKKKFVDNVYKDREKEHWETMKERQISFILLFFFSLLKESFFLY